MEILVNEIVYDTRSMSITENNTEIKDFAFP